MKRLSVLALALICALCLMPAAFAEEKCPVESIVVSCDLPVQGESPSRQPPEVELRLPSDQEELKETDWGILDEETGWYDDATGKAIKLDERDLFVNGRDYLIKVSFKIFKEGVTVENDTQIFVNGKKASFAVSGSGEDTEYEITCRFVCTPARIAPKVTLQVEGNGETERVFDGKSIVLKADVEETDGISYTYQWYCDDAAVAGQNADTIKLRDVSQSGKYYCKVGAFVTTDENRTTVETDSASQTVTITPIPCVIRIENAEKNLFEKDPSFTYRVEGEILDELQGEPAREAGEDIGKYAIGAGTLSFAADKKDNYKLEIVSGYLTILKPDELPFSAVSNVADLSYITGKNGAKVLVSASRGALPEGAMVTLRILEEGAAGTLATLSAKEILKGISLSVVDDNGKPVTLPKHATLRLQIPLTEEEEAMEVLTIGAGFVGESSTILSPTASVSEDGVVFLTVEFAGVGSVALFRGSPKGAEGEAPADPVPKGNFTPLIWTLIILFAILATGAIVFSVVWTRKNRVSSPKKAKEKKPEAEKEPEKEPEKEKAEAAHRERIERIAEEINAMPPVPEAEEEKAKEKKAKTRVISFEDLEG